MRHRWEVEPRNRLFRLLLPVVCPLIERSVKQDLETIARRAATLPRQPLGEGEAMRALDCECGRHLEAANDEELFERAREHVDRDHPDMGFNNEQVRGIVEQGAYGK